LEAAATSFSCQPQWVAGEQRGNEAQGDRPGSSTKNSPEFLCGLHFGVSETGMGLGLADFLASAKYKYKPKVPNPPKLLTKIFYFKKFVRVLEGTWIL